MSNMFSWTKKKNKGATAAGFVAFLQGAEGILFSLFGFVFMYTAMTPSFSAADLGAKEIVCLSITLILFYRHIKKAWQLAKTRKGRWYLLSGVMTATGNLFYIIAVASAGSSYGVVLTAMYPVFSMILMRIIFRDKQRLMAWVGVAVAVIGGLLFLILPSIIHGGDFGTKQIIGMLLGGIGAFLWAIEGMLIKKGNDIKELKVDSRDVVLLRTASSTIVTWVMIMPLFAIPGSVLQGESNPHNSYYWFAQIFSHWESVLIVLVTASSVAALRMIHLYAIKTIGPKLTAIIDTNNFWIPAFFNIFLTYLGSTFINSDVQIFEPIIWWAWFLMIPIATGSLMVVAFEKEMVPHKNPVLEKEE